MRLMDRLFSASNLRDYLNDQGISKESSDEIYEKVLEFVRVNDHSIEHYIHDLVKQHEMRYEEPEDITPLFPDVVVKGRVSLGKSK